MGAGQSNHKLAAIIQARNGSTRMPGKVLMSIPFPNGKPLLKHIVDSVRKITIIDKVIVATSTEPVNNSIADFCNLNNIEIYRGSENDVQSRFIDLIEAGGFEHVVRLTGDNPIIDIKKLLKTINYHIETFSDYTKTKGLPLGMNFEVIRASTIEKRKFAERTEEEKEHVTYFLAKGDYKINYLEFEESLSHIRATIDYPSDFAFVSLLFQIANTESLSLELIIDLLDKHPWLIQINENMTQKIVS